MKRSRLLILFFSILIIGIFSTLSFYYSFIVIHVEKIPMDLTVSDRIGFNSDTDALHFGKVFPGGISRRNINIQNSYDYNIHVIIANNGNISGFISPEDNDFLLSPGTNRTIWYMAEPPVGTKLSRYEGFSKIIIKRDYN